MSFNWNTTLLVLLARFVNDSNSYCACIVARLTLHPCFGIYHKAACICLHGNDMIGHTCTLYFYSGNGSFDRYFKSCIHCILVIDGYLYWPDKQVPNIFAGEG